MPREHTGHSKQPPPTTQEMALHIDIIRWSILKLNSLPSEPSGKPVLKSDSLYSLQPKMEELYTVRKKKRLRADCGSDHELLIIKFRLKLKKVVEITRPFRYLNQIPYNYTVEMTNRFKRLDLIECLKNYGWRFIIPYWKHCSKPSPRKRGKKAKWLSEEVSQIIEKIKSKRQRRKGKIYRCECRVPKNNKEI